MRADLPRVAEWWLRLLLRLQPRAFRDRHGAEMLEFAADAWSDRAASGSVWAKVAIIARLSADAIQSGMRSCFPGWCGPAGEGIQHAAARDDPLLPAVGRGREGCPEAREQCIGSFERSGRIRWMDEMSKDVGYAIRMLRRAPGFAAAVVATLALGIGGTTAVFSVVQAVLLAPLPYERPDQLVRLYQQYPENPSYRLKIYLAGPQFKEIRDHAVSFQDVAALDTYSDRGRDLVSDGRAVRLRVLPVSSGYFRTLGTSLHRGREFDREDEVGTSRVVLSHALWRTRFDADPSAIGTTIRLSDEPTQIVGIAPPGFQDPLVGEVDAWVPYNLAEQTSPHNNGITAIGRLRSGVTVEQARAELATMSRSMAERWPAASRNVFDVVPLKDDLVRTARAPLRLLMIAVGLVLLLVCVNVANLILVRATGRANEFGIRAALGSGGVRIARQLMVESVLLAVLGVVLGLAVAELGVAVLKVLGRNGIARLDEVGFDPVVLGFAVLVTLATAIAIGVAPAIRFARVDPNRVLGQQSRSATGDRGQGRLRNGLAAAQLALALTLLTGGGVLMASFYRLQQLDLGFRVDRVLTFELNLPSARYETERRASFQGELSRQLEAIPGVTAAGGISYLPATGGYNQWSTRIMTGALAGTSMSTSRGYPNIQQRFVIGDLFTALEIPLLAGRTFEPQDATSDPARAVVSARFAERAFPGVSFEDVVGQRIIVPSGGSVRDIIGVVGDVPLDAHGSPALTVYHANGNPARPLFSRRTLRYVVATELPPERILPAVRDEVAAMDPGLVVHNPASISDVVSRGVSRDRFALGLMGAFAAMAALLAVLGLYGVLAYTVRQRSQEIGIRMALGATPARIRTLVLRQAGVVVGIGLVAGIGGALVLGRWLSSLVFEISPSDPRIFLSTAVGLAIAAFLSAWLPARRAAQLDPRVAMQEE